MKIRRNQGIGLIEALIATVVIAVGLVALASMQGNFLSSSSDSKTRSEALVLAKQKIEELRNNIVVGDYSNIATNNDSVNGSNETFTRSWTVTPQTNPGRKDITVTVTWGGASVDETVFLSSEISFSDPANSVALANFGEVGHGSYGQAPSPNQSASETVVNESNMSTVDSAGNKSLLSGTSDVYVVQDSSGNDIYVKETDGTLNKGFQVYLISSLNQFDVDLTKEVSNDADPSNDVYLYTRRLDEDGIVGNEVIELFSDNGDGTATLQHRYFGGVIVSIKGTINTVYNLDDIKIDFNKEDMICVFSPGSLQSTRKYACYTGGNCDVSPAGDNSDVTRCPDPSAADAKVGHGGFSGNVGLINVDDHGGGKESVCYAEDLTGTSTSLSTARKYKSTNPNRTPTEEGINESYNCQDFLIVGRQANLTQLAAECTDQISNFPDIKNLPPKEIERIIASGADNTVVVGANNTYCSPLVSTLYTLTGSITGISGGTTSVEALGNTCTLLGADFTCSVSTTGHTIEITATNIDGTVTKTGSCVVANLDAASPTGSCDIEVTVPPTYTATGTISGPTGGLAVTITDGNFSNNCTVATVDSTKTFNCSISTNETIVTIEATKSNKYDSCTYSNLSSSNTTLPRDGDATCTLDVQ